MSVKRLTKNTSNKMVCGVCSGIADYFEVDPTIVRILAILFSGVILYFILAIIMPTDTE